MAALLLLGVLAVLLGTGLRRGRGSGRRGRSGRWRQESGSLLPPPPQGLFPPSPHERLHDQKYLQRILRADLEKRSQADSPERQGTPDRPEQREGHPGPASPGSPPPSRSAE